MAGNAAFRRSSQAGSLKSVKVLLFLKRWDESPAFVCNGEGDHLGRQGGGGKTTFEGTASNASSSFESGFVFLSDSRLLTHVYTV